jgi:type II secretory pathway pseudopilin PulG
MRQAVKKGAKMRPANAKLPPGLTLIELVITIVISSLLILTVGILLLSGQRAWKQTYESAHKKIKQDAQSVMTAFGSMGRKANRIDYRIYNISGSSFTPAVPHTSNPEEVVSGDAVEFRYWDVELDTADSHSLMDVTKTATAYTLFYIDGDSLKLDYGPYPPGGVPANGGARNTAGVTTTILADNVSTDPNRDAFSHTTLNRIGQGCVRLNVTLTDPNDNETIKVMTAVMMRNIWPR